MTRIAVIYYSMYGHVGTLARKVFEGVKSVPGVEASLFQISETLNDDILSKMHAPAKAEDVPYITAAELPDYDGYIFGFPTRYGQVPAQFKAFWDSTGGLWTKGALAGKGYSIFTSTGTIAGGQETTVLTSLPMFSHHAMVFVPTGYTMGPRMFEMGEVRGGSAYGAGTYAGPDGSRQPTDLELELAQHQGKYVTGILRKLAAPEPKA
ncbi:hypothetical protein H632_c676p1 [Helicosporidium sp. ATCC 50920]|nr:hypothetical protein H632_c676p1 [Helicosporidium sp. ATCC 50920]|eukprot:KDD75456.1 hypothetical protein H632_c676p1 [Helicosporidium sp. ATCC 50920]